MEDIRWTELWPFKSQFPWLDPHNHTYPEYMLMDELRLEGVRNMSGFRRESPEPKPLSPSPNDWIVTGEEVHENEVIILTGNLIIQAGGNLTLINCTLLMNCTYDGEWQIRVERGGIMNVLEGSNITAYNPNYEFLFYVYGRLVMRDSELHECGCNRYHPGLWLETDEGVVIENCTISQNWCGVWCEHLSNITIANCRISYNEGDGIYCGSSNITIYNTMISNNEYGIYCDYYTSNISIIGCTISNNWFGICCVCSSYVTIRDCSIVHDGVFLFGEKLVHFASHTIENNTVNGKPLYYIVNTTSYTVPSDASEIIIVNSSNITIGNINASWTGVGVEIAYSSGISIADCTISNNEWWGITCWGSSDISIVNCTISFNGWYIPRDDGIAIWRSSGINIIDCTISDNGDGIYCDCYTSNINIIGCTISSSEGRQEDGITCSGSSGINIIDCTISDNWFGIYCDYYTSNISIIDCTISDNVDGMRIYSCSNVSIVNCVISDNWGNGVYCYGSSDIRIKGCTISNNWDNGIYCDWSSKITVHYCNIYSNQDHGLYNDGEYIVNATYCWWGSPEGPEYKEEGDSDDPEEVYSYYGPEYLIFDPWLTEPYRRAPKPSRCFLRFLSKTALGNIIDVFQMPCPYLIGFSALPAYTHLMVNLIVNLEYGSGLVGEDVEILLDERAVGTVVVEDPKRIGVNLTLLLTPGLHKLRIKFIYQGTTLTYDLINITAYEPVFSKDGLAFNITRDAYHFRNWDLTWDEFCELTGWIWKEYGLPDKLLAPLYPLTMKGGHCFGMAYTSSAFFTDMLDRPRDVSTYALNTEEVLRLIAIYHIMQPYIIEYYGEELGPMEAFNKVKELIDEGIPPILCTKAHAVLC
ncbi:hypothetical protein DRO32_05340, partial [Candidatus Bathyarchaeota archaeon]